MNQIDLTNRAAIVAGGARGIGLAIARRLLDSGARVSRWAHPTFWHARLGAGGAAEISRWWSQAEPPELPPNIRPPRSGGGDVRLIPGFQAPLQGLATVVVGSGGSARSSLDHRLIPIAPPAQRSLCKKMRFARYEGGEECSFPTGAVFDLSGGRATY